MSQDQAAGLRQWADSQRQKQAPSQPDAPLASDMEVMSEAPAPAPGAVSPTPTIDEQPVAKAPSRPKKPLYIIGLPGQGAQAVKQAQHRLAQWSALGRHWAGSPDDWDIQAVSVNAPDLAQLSARHARWALWVNSDADAFAEMYRLLRQARDNGGPRRLLALHEPSLSRQGLLENLREAASHYLATDLLVLAR